MMGWYRSLGGLRVILFWLTLMIIPLIIFGLVLLTEDPGPDTPYGCTWIDMDLNKGSDYQLACVEGYGED